MAKFLKGKIVFVGDTSVGKTSIINSYNNDKGVVKPTVAASSIPCNVDYEGEVVTLSIWDTAGQEDFHCLVPMYARSSQVAVIVFDLTNEQTFDHIENWHKYLESSGNIPNIFLVGNKLDLQNDIIPDINDKMDQIAKKYNMKTFQTSAQLGQNIDVLFYAIAEAVQTTEQEGPLPQVSITREDNPKGKNSSCNC
ncbi:GTP-binding protein YPT53 [Tritrichomonas foetus]|uniref:GTP-binding protein YPT53 n=1 Tax=Tritrichomonas foetus TaxID=1144522 RepID=A0A1J4KMC2_9EUKA|nr:GTP-binding protein YPT53 [Tritrichomonas foetus]|eukprot:OHT10948.1 GTP-binding protein YPT53 [Tritrichomonas foetus]